MNRTAVNELLVTCLTWTLCGHPSSVLAPESPSGNAQPWLCKPDRAHVQARQELEITTHLWLGAAVRVLCFYVAFFWL